MWANLLVGLLARPWARRAAPLALVVLTIAPVILNLRRTAERAGHAAECLKLLGCPHPINRQLLDTSSHGTRSRAEASLSNAEYPWTLPAESCTVALTYTPKRALKEP